LGNPQPVGTSENESSILRQRIIRVSGATLAAGSLSALMTALTRIGVAAEDLDDVHVATVVLHELARRHPVPGGGLRAYALAFLGPASARALTPKPTTSHISRQRVRAAVAVAGLRGCAPELRQQAA
jgi:hypothetical protein